MDCPHEHSWQGYPKDLAMLVCSICDEMIRIKTLMEDVRKSTERQTSYETLERGLRNNWYNPGARKVISKDVYRYQQKHTIPEPIALFKDNQRKANHEKDILPISRRSRLLQSRQTP